MKSILKIGCMVLCICFVRILPIQALDPLDQAQLFMEKGLYRQAIDLLIPVLDTHDEDSASRAAEMLYALFSIEKEPERSLEALEVFVGSFPASSLAPLYMYWIAKLEEDLLRYDRAEVRYKEIIEHFVSPGQDIYEVRPMAMEDLARLLGTKKARYGEAIELYRRLITEYPDLENPTHIQVEIGSLYEATGKIEKALAVYTAILESPDTCFYRDLASLRLLYLRSEPVWARDSMEALAEELIFAFQSSNIDELTHLARKGDFWAGQMYSEFDIMEFARVGPYLERYLENAALVFGKPARENGEARIRITGWPDPQFNIIYLLLERGIFGWEWKGIILSEQELEEEFW